MWFRGVHVVHVGELGGGNWAATSVLCIRVTIANASQKKARVKGLEKEWLGRHGSCTSNLATLERQTKYARFGYGGPSLVLLTCGGGRRPDEIDDLAACATTKDCGMMPKDWTVDILPGLGSCRQPKNDLVEAHAVQSHLDEFVAGWQAHGAALTAQPRSCTGGWCFLPWTNAPNKPRDAASTLLFCAQANRKPAPSMSA